MSNPVSKEIGKAAVRAMEHLWRMPLKDDDREGLRTLTVEAGIDWRTQIDWWNLWCATCCAWAFRHVGEYLVDGQCVDVGLDEEIARYFWASTTRLVGRGTRTYETQGIEPPIEVDFSDVRAGDVLLITTPRTDRPWGDHVALARGASEGGVVETIAGNEEGEGPNGEVYKGVVIGGRARAEVAKALRVPRGWVE